MLLSTTLFCVLHLMNTFKKWSYHYYFEMFVTNSNRCCIEKTFDWIIC